MTCPSASSGSYIIIDGTFRIDDLFKFVDRTPIEMSSASRAHTGALHINRRYVKDVFSVRFPKLTCSQYAQLQIILRATGYDALHTVEYGNSCGTRKWDGTTAWGYGINEDVRRTRAKVHIPPPAFPHWDNIADTFSVDLECEEA